MREKPTPEREEIARFVNANNLGVLVVAEGSTLTTLVGVGVAASRRPFTFPQVTQLIELASIIESSIAACARLSSCEFATSVRSSMAFSSFFMA